MGKLVGYIIGNPTIILWIALAGFLAGIGAGGSVAWYVQGIRVNHARAETEKVKAEFETFKSELKKQEAENAEKAQQESAKNGEDYRKEKDELLKQIEAGEVFRRCVAAGKCGASIVRVQSCSSGSPSASSQARSGANATGADSIPIGREGSTERSEDAALNECAVTTLMLNKLQERIELQDGY